MNIIDIEKDCLGCSACIDICPVDALIETQDENGFYIPSIDSNKCINCEKCIKVCPAIDSTKKEIKAEYFYGWNNDEEVRMRSSSGGIFRAIADHVLKKDGVVFGAKYSEDFQSVEMDSSNNVSIDALQRSKYVQASADGLYRKISHLLGQGKTVLLTGTPCQIAAAKKFFGDHTDNLILVDFLCGGSVSPKCYSEYIQWLENKYKSKIAAINFRNKKKGWVNCSIKVDFKNKRTYSSRYDFDPYYYYFECTPYTKNKACLDCKFTRTRYADITIADFWGFRKLKLEHDNKGLSLIVAHTARGKHVLNQLDNVTFHSLTEEEGAYGFKPKRNNPEKRAAREAFLEEIKQSGFMKVAEKYYYKNGKIGVAYRKIIRRIKELLG